MANLLLTGYEPFDGFSVNPSEELVKSLQDRKLGAYQINGVVLPLDYTKAFDMLEPHIDNLRPEIILCTGQANRGAITIERIAVNVQSTLKEDNYGNRPDDDIIIPNAPAGYFATINPHSLIELLQREGIPAQVSYHAGTYGCNWILFHVLHKIEAQHLGARSTFIHLPPLPVQAIEKNRTDLPNMQLSDQLRAIELIIGAL